MIIPERNHYNLNPPEPIAYDFMFEDAVDENLYDEKDRLNFIDLDELRNTELIKNESQRQQFI